MKIGFGGAHAFEFPTGGTPLWSWSVICRGSHTALGPRSAPCVMATTAALGRAPPPAPPLLPIFTILLLPVQPQGGALPLLAFHLDLPFSRSPQPDLARGRSARNFTLCLRLQDRRCGLPPAPLHIQTADTWGCSALQAAHPPPKPAHSRAGEGVCGRSHAEFDWSHAMDSHEEGAKERVVVYGDGGGRGGGAGAGIPWRTCPGPWRPQGTGEAGWRGRASTAVCWRGQRRGWSWVAWRRWMRSSWRTRSLHGPKQTQSMGAGGRAVSYPTQVSIFTQGMREDAHEHRVRWWGTGSAIRRWRSSF